VPCHQEQLYRPCTDWDHLLACRSVPTHRFRPTMDSNHALYSPSTRIQNRLLRHRSNEGVFADLSTKYSWGHLDSVSLWGHQAQRSSLLFKALGRSLCDRYSLVKDWVRNQHQCHWWSCSEMCWNTEYLERGRYRYYWDILGIVWVVYMFRGRCAERVGRWKGGCGLEWWFYLRQI